VPDASDIRPVLEAWLRDRIAGATAVRMTEPRSPAAGESSDTRLFEMEVEHAGAYVERVDAVLRCAPSAEGNHPFPEYDLGLQAHVMRALRATGGVPVPEVLFLEEDPSVLGVPFLIMRAVAGDAPLDRPSYQAEGFYHEGARALREHVWSGTVEALAQLHALDWRALGAGVVPGSRPGDDPARVSLDYWSRYLRDFLKEEPEEPVAVFDEAHAFLVQERPAPSRLALCWGDAKLGNVLYAPGARDVAAVIDWEMAIIGDPIADLASLHLSDLRAQDFGQVTMDGTPTADELVALYERASGLPVENFHYNLVFATFWRGAVQIAVTRQMRRRGVEIPDVMFVDNFPMNQLRR
jgi:aminoglycoside phosphotransferase (APT) family kinase protein